jgi:hypothetical protein
VALQTFQLRPLWTPGLQNLSDFAKNQQVWLGPNFQNQLKFNHKSVKVQSNSLKFGEKQQIWPPLNFLTAPIFKPSLTLAAAS